MQLFLCLLHIMGNGRICRIEDTEQKIYGLTKIMEHMAPGAKAEFCPEMLEGTAVFGVDVDRFTRKERRR